ncbi:MAG: hypothetical protein OEY34_00725 [Cyclobacteriaceae bacterium]|nr:hypothetical protein [Cyclobacteriaceae bacterium]
MKRNFFNIFLLLLFTSVGCSEEEPLFTTRIHELYLNSSERVTINGTTLELHAYLWRDFMPVSPPDGQPLRSINWLVDVDSIEVPGYIHLAEQFVIYGDSLWNAPYTEGYIMPQPYVVERMSTGGPKWDPFVEVTVMAKVIDSSTGAAYLLKREKQLIHRTD